MMLVTAVMVTRTREGDYLGNNYSNLYYSNTNDKANEL